MQPDTRNTSPEFPPDELLIFIGHSDDASAEANAILELQSEIEKDFRLLLKTHWRSLTVSSHQAVGVEF